MHRFNTVGPCLPELHFMLPASRRSPGVHDRVLEGGLIALSGPPLSGRSTALRELARALQAEHRVTPLLISCDRLSRHPVQVEHDLIGTIRQRARISLSAEDALPERWPGAAPPGARITVALGEWSAAARRPIVLLLDDLDQLAPVANREVLRQAAAALGEPGGPLAVLYATAHPPPPEAATPDTVAPVVHLLDLCPEDVAVLAGQYTREAGQAFTNAALDRLGELSLGQPWVVSAIANTVAERLGLDARDPVDDAHIDEAVQRLVALRPSPLLRVQRRLGDPGLRAVLVPLLQGHAPGGADADLRRARDLGLVTRGHPPRLANRVYELALAAAAEAG